jgi:hypothetical protein
MNDGRQLEKVLLFGLFLLLIFDQVCEVINYKNELWLILYEITL